MIHCQFGQLRLTATRAFCAELCEHLGSDTCPPLLGADVVADLADVLSAVR